MYKEEEETEDRGDRKHLASSTNQKPILTLVPPPNPRLVYTALRIWKNNSLWFGDVVYLHESEAAIIEYSVRKHYKNSVHERQKQKHL